MKVSPYLSLGTEPNSRSYSGRSPRYSTLASHIRSRILTRSAAIAHRINCCASRSSTSTYLILRDLRIRRRQNFFDPLRRKWSRGHTFARSLIIWLGIKLSSSTRHDHSSDPSAGSYSTRVLISSASDQLWITARNSMMTVRGSGNGYRRERQLMV